MAEQESLLPREDLISSKGNYYMLMYIFFERFAYYGMMAIMVMYLRQSLKYSDDLSTFVFHTFIMLATFLLIVGGILADALVGKFEMIFYFSLLYTFGVAMLAFSSSMTSVELVRDFTIPSLGLIAVGYGLCKPSFIAFAGEQFVLPYQKNNMEKFFSQIYITVNVASLISIASTPSLRQDIECQDRTTCFPVPFGLCAVFILFASISFRIGLRFYKLKPIQGTVVLKVWNCIWYALYQRIRKRKEKRDHWLLYADDKYDTELITNTKTTLHVLLMFIPVPIYYALHPQMMSRWIIQASNMSGDIGFYNIKPDHMLLLNPLLVIIIVPTLDNIIYPTFRKFRLCTGALQKMTTGGFVAALAFMMSGLLELSIEESYPLVARQHEAHLRIFNGFNCPATLQLEDLPSHNVSGLSVWEELHLYTVGSQEFQATVELDSSCSSMTQSTWNGAITIFEKKAVSYFITYSSEGEEVSVVRDSPEDEISKSLESKAKIRLLYKFLNTEDPTRVELVHENEKYTKQSNLSPDKVETDTWEVPCGRYKVLVNKIKVKDIELNIGGVYTLVVQKNSESEDFGSMLFTITPSNNMHMLWQIPQMFTITVGEVMFNIPGMEFSYSQAPKAMKSVIQSAWMLCSCLGNIIIMVIAKWNPLEKQSYEFFMFSLMFALDMLVFAILAMSYKYVSH